MGGNTKNDNNSNFKQKKKKCKDEKDYLTLKKIKIQKQSIAINKTIVNITSLKMLK